MEKSTLRTQLLLIIIGVTVLIAVIITAADVAHFRATYRLALENQALAEARYLRESLHDNLNYFALDNLPGITARLQALVAADDAFAYAYIADARGVILHHTRPARIGQPADFPLFDAVVFRGAGDVVTFEANGAYEVAIPLLHVDNIVGVLHVAVDARAIGSQVLAVFLIRAGIFSGLLVVIGGFIAGFTTRYVNRPLARLKGALQQVAEGDFAQTVPVLRDDEIGELTDAFNAMTAHLQERVADLEQRVAERTRDAELRAAHLRAAAEVGRSITSILDTDRLLNQVVMLIRQRFQMYYVGLFLLDASGDWAELRASDGAAGDTLLQEGFRIPVGEGLIGWSIVNARLRLVADVRDDHTRIDVRALPDTRSEVALPLRSRGEVIGALSVQSDAYDAFDADFLEVLQTLADEVAVVIDNTRLFARTQEALEAQRQTYGELTRRAWRQMLAAREAWGYEYEGGDAPRRVEGEWDEAMAQARRIGRSVKDAAAARLAIPIRERQEVVGVLGLEKPEAGADWSADEIALLETLAERLGVALESARSYQDTQKRAAREQLMGAVTARVRESLDIDQVMQTAVEQIRVALGLREAVIQLGAVDVSDWEQ